MAKIEAHIRQNAGLISQALTMRARREDTAEGRLTSFLLAWERLLKGRRLRRPFAFGAHKTSPWPAPEPATQPLRVYAAHELFGIDVRTTNLLGSQTLARWVAGSSPAMVKGGACQWYLKTLQGQLVLDSESTPRLQAPMKSLTDIRSTFLDDAGLGTQIEQVRPSWKCRRRT